MTNLAYTDINRRQDFVLLFDVADGNPNGDPDAGNLPRVDPETMQGLVTDVALKRKVRDWVDAVRGDESRFKIYIQSGEALNAKHQRAYDDLEIRSTGTRQNRADVDRAREWMCGNFYDIRLFGAVMTTGVNCGQVRGPVQMTFARSIDPIVPLDLSITRIAVTRIADAEVEVSDEDGTGQGGKQTEMGRKALVPYGLYKAPRVLQSSLRDADRGGPGGHGDVLERPGEHVGSGPLVRPRPDGLPGPLRVQPREQAGQCTRTHPFRAGLGRHARQHHRPQEVPRLRGSTRCVRNARWGWYDSAGWVVCKVDITPSGTSNPLSIG